MGTIIELRRNVDRQKPSIPPVPGRSAEILFFSGVRYARNEDQTSVAMSLAKPKRVRKSNLKQSS